MALYNIVKPVVYQAKFDSSFYPTMQHNLIKWSENREGMKITKEIEAYKKFFLKKID